MPPRAWQPVLAVMALSLIASLWLAASIPLIDPDEGRNAEVAREMVERGDLVIPHLAGMPYLDKPPGFYWAAAAAIRLFGASPIAVRLPSILAACLTLWILARAALRDADPGFALRLVALTAAAPLFTLLAAYVIFDMALACCITMVWTGLARELTVGPSSARRAGMFLAVALGVLIKGPVMLAWALGGSLAAVILLRRLDPLTWLTWWPGWTMVLAFAGGWFALASARHPEYPRYAFLEESFERLTSGSFRREQPWWFVPAVLVAGAFPWSLATPWHRLRGARMVAPVADDDRAPRGVARPARAWNVVPEGGGRGPRAVGLSVALAFVLFAAVFFTLSRSKLVTYLLPALPPLAWLAAAAWGRVGAPMRRWGFLAMVLVAPVLVAAAAPALDRYAWTQSGAPLARAIGPAANGRVRYEACYSPGTDFLLGRRGELVDADGATTTSNYQLRYRAALVARGLWTPLPTPHGRLAERAMVLVRPVSRAADPPEGWREFHRDHRFVAYRRIAS